MKKYKYSDHTQNDTRLDPIIKIQKYSKIESFSYNHNENDCPPDTNKRHLVFMTYLNDDVEQQNEISCIRN